MIAGWEQLSAAMATAREEIAAASPDVAVAAEGEAYLLRVLTAILADGVLGHLLWEGGLSRALPTRGGPNPDYLMTHAGVDTSRRYRLEGELNGSERVGVGLYAFTQDGTALEAGYRTFDRGNTPDGRFALDLAPEGSGPADLPIPPNARALLVRTLHRSDAPPARLRVAGNPPPRDLALATGSTEGALVQAGQMLLRSTRQFLEWSRVTSAAPNQLKPPPPHMAAAVQGDPDTTYFLGYYQLDEGERLQVTMPDGLAGYWSLHAYNHWCEALPGAGVHDLNAKPDGDGRIRLRIGPAVAEGALNRIDTLGRRRGVLICRIVGQTVAAAPEVQLVRT